MKIKKVKSLSLTVVVILFDMIHLASTAQNTVNSILFYGNHSSANKSGGEYLVFRLSENEAVGLVYIQDSGVGSCFKGKYNSLTNQIENPLYASMDMDTEKWEYYQSNESLSLKNFPYQLNYRDISIGADQWLKECYSIMKSKN